MNTPEKQCIDCKQFFPATPEYFTRQRSRPDGLCLYCKACKKIRRTPYEEAHREEARSRASKWFNEHRERARANRYAYYHSDPARFVKAAKDWERRNPEKHKLSARRNYRRHWDQYQSYGRERRARLAGQSEHHTPADVRRQYKAQKGRCYYCGVKLHHKFEIDHVVPLIRGGADTADNIVCACQFCNRSKGDKLVHEWGKPGRLF